MCLFIGFTVGVLMPVNILVMSYVNIAVDIGMCVSLILPGLNGIAQLII